MLRTYSLYHSHLLHGMRSLSMDVFVILRGLWAYNKISISLRSGLARIVP